MIKIQGLQKVVEQNTVLDISQLRVKQGEVITIVGFTDTGRDLLLRILTEEPDCMLEGDRLARICFRVDSYESAPWEYLPRLINASAKLDSSSLQPR
jgi:ABC-type phosphate/phosphonate transport system ATPase subunit